MSEKEYEYWLSTIPGIGAVKIAALLQMFSCPEEIFYASRNELLQCASLREGEIEALIKSRDTEKVKKEWTNLVKSKIDFITRNDERYPERLQHIYGAPYALYVKGELPKKDRITLAVIGARECTEYGMEITRFMTGALARAGIGIISGLARGIDSIAHRSALEAEGYTYGILGCGIDICYPKENINLYMDMQKEGGIISEYAPGTKPLSCNFPMRNRIISGLSDGILVIEAREKSGTLITVDMGLDQGKNIYALPGRITDHLSAGCNNLIKLGAKCVTSPQDILEDFQMDFIQNDMIKDERQRLQTPAERLIYELLGPEPMHIDQIAMKTRLSLDELMEQLLAFELKGLVHQNRKNYYVRSL